MIISIVIKMISATAWNIRMTEIMIGMMNITGPKLPFRTTLPGYCQGAGIMMRGVSPDRKQGGSTHGQGPSAAMISS